MKELPRHKPKDSKHQEKIYALDEPGAGGAHLAYRIEGFDNEIEHTIYFQNGDPSEVGINGTTDEALIAIVIDRLSGFQEGKFPCEENAQALTNFALGLELLGLRTKKRIFAGVEGKQQALGDTD